MLVRYDACVRDMPRSMEKSSKAGITAAAVNVDSRYLTYILETDLESVWPQTNLADLYILFDDLQYWLCGE